MSDAVTSHDNLLSRRSTMAPLVGAVLMLALAWTCWPQTWWELERVEVAHAKSDSEVGVFVYGMRKLAVAGGFSWLLIASGLLANLASRRARASGSRVRTVGRAILVVAIMSLAVQCLFVGPKEFFGGLVMAIFGPIDAFLMPIQIFLSF